MAKGIELKVRISTDGTIKLATEDLKKFSAQASKTTAKAKKMNVVTSRTKRKLEAVGKESLSSGKAFARQAQGMGGLVAAYATVAANVFALSAAFLVLRRAADLSSMIKSAEDFSNRFGVSVTRITKQMQEASGGALDFAEALPTINKAVSAGVGIEQIEKLTIAATKAAQTFGGSTTEALNRFISAAQRGRVEIIQTLGVVIKTEQAYKDYAATIGKTALELTAVDRQQAILNATIVASEKVFAGVTIDPNPFQQLLVTLTDTKDTILTFLTDGLTPMIKLFNQSKDAALALIAVIAASVGGRIFPEISSGIVALQAKSIASTKAARVAAAQANRKAIKAQSEHAKNTIGINQDKVRKQLLIEQESYKKRLIKHKSFGKIFIAHDGQINRAVLTEQRAALARQEKAILRGTGKGLQKGLSTDISVIREQKRARDALTSSTQKLGIAEAKNTAARTVGTTKIRQRTTALLAWGAAAKSVGISIKSNLVTGFSKSFAAVQASVIVGVRRMTQEWVLFSRSINTSRNSLLLFSSAVGRTAGVIAGGFAKALSAATSLLLIVSLLRLGWELFGDRIQGITKEQRKMLDGVDTLNEGLEELNERTNNFTNALNTGSTGLSSFIANMEFLRGTTDSFLNEVRNFESTIGGAFDGATLDTFRIKFEQLNNEILESKRLTDSFSIEKFNATEFRGRLLRGDIGDRTVDSGNQQVFEAETAAQRKMTGELIIQQSIFEKIKNDTLPKLINSFKNINDLMTKIGFQDLGGEAADKLKVILAGSVDNAGELVRLLSEGKNAEFFKAFNNLNIGQQTSFIQEFIKVTRDLSREGQSAAASFAAAGKSLQETNKNISTFFLGLDKLKAASIPNKEQFNFLLDIENQLVDLQKTAKQDGGLASIIGKVITDEQLSNIQKFVGITSKSTLTESIDATRVALSKYRAVIDDSINAASELKILQTRIQLFKSEELTTEARRLQLINLTNQALVAQAKRELDVTQNSISVAKFNLASSRLFNAENSFSVAQSKLSLAVLIEQEKVGKLKVENAENNLDFERKTFAIGQANLKSSQAINSVLISAATLSRKESTNANKDLKIRTEIFNRQKDNLKLKMISAELEIKSLEVAKKTDLEALNKTIELQAQLTLLEAQTVQLERQALILSAETLENAGGSIFSEVGMKKAAEFFIQEVRDQARNLKTTFEILGRGFVDVIDGTFDTAVDNLLEGGKDFGRTVIEALKAGLRDVIGNAIKTQIKAAIATLFEPKKSSAEIAAEQRAAIVAAQHAENILSRQALIASNEKLIAKNCGAAEAVDTSTFGPRAKLGPRVKVESKAKSGLETIQANIQATNEQGNVTLNSIFDLTKTGVAVAEEAKEISSEGFGGLLGSIGNLLSSLVGGSGGDGAGSAILGIGKAVLGGFFGFGKGGIVQGGITPMATGGVTRGPNLALIGEGKNEEAVVPLPNNREIPVDLKGGGDTVMIEQNFDFTNAAPESVSQLRAEAKNIEERTFNRVFTEINKGGKFAQMSGRRAR